MVETGRNFENLEFQVYEMLKYALGFSKRPVLQKDGKHSKPKTHHWLLVTIRL